ncbi:nucleotidyltransferase family protein [uncultured Gilvimarinus sp.]|uniref:nucleotidyltransferase family protein n=1 Tax=uncultured Gilvimarinus sp. TaxID=1689143 RepID=UPI0030ED4CCD
MTELEYEQRLKGWLWDDAYRMALLTAAAELALPDWCLAAGFVRNLVWDKLHHYTQATPLNDIDFIYFSADEGEIACERRYEKQLQLTVNAPWSVKNQARMHRRNADAPYCSSVDAMSYWVELETAVGVYWADNRIELVAPFGLAPLFAGTVTRNRRCRSAQAFSERLTQKNWQRHWPKLSVISAG